MSKLLIGCESNFSQEIGKDDIFVLYDDKYFGPGYLIVSKLGDEIIKFIKISTYGEGGFPNIVIRGYEKGKVDIPDVPFRNISIDVQKESTLYDVFYNLANSIGNKKIYSSNPTEQGTNHMYVVETSSKVSLNLVKDVYGVKCATDFVDIFIGDYYSCEEYLHILEFYKNLSTISLGKTNEIDIKQMIKK